MLAVLSSGGTTSLSRHLKKAFHTGLNVSPSDSICWWMGKSPSSCQYPRNAIPPTGWCRLSTITESLHNSILRKKNISAVRNSKKINKKTPKNHQRWKRFTSCSRGIYVLDIACVSGSFLTDSDHQSYCSAHLKAGFWTSHEIRCVSKPRADYSPPVKVTANFPNSENLGISLFFLA